MLSLFTLITIIALITSHKEIANGTFTIMRIRRNSTQSEGHDEVISLLPLIPAAHELAVACGDGSAEVQPASSPRKAVLASTPPSTKEVITSPIVGAYSTTITQKDVAAKPDLAADLGTHTWTFRSDGTHGWLYRGPCTQNTADFNVAGSYQAAQGELSMKDAACAFFNFPWPGTYMWQLKGNDLIVQVKSDDCVDRKLVLTMHPLVKQSS